MRYLFKLFALVSVLYLLGCTKSATSENACAVATSAESAVQKLGENQKRELQTWQSSTFKRCQIDSVFPSLKSNFPNDQESEELVDLNKFLERTNHSMILSNPDDASEVIAFAKPHIFTAPEKTSVLACDQPNSKVQYEAVVTGTHCEIKLDGHVVAKTDLVQNISVALHVSQTKLEYLFSLPSTVHPGERTSGNNVVSLRTNAFTDPVRQALTSADIMKPGTTPNDPWIVAFPTRQHIQFLLKLKFPEIDSDFLEKKFLSGTAFTDSSFVTTDSTLGDIAPFSNGAPQIIGSNSFEMSKLWDGGISGQKHFIYNFEWKSAFPKIPRNNVDGNSDPKFLTVNTRLEFNGNVKNGGVARVLDLTINYDDKETPENAFTKCALKRLDFVLKVHGENGQPALRFEDVIAPCRFAAPEQKIAKLILNEKNLKSQFLSAIVKSSKKSSPYDYNDWTNLWLEILAELPLKSNDFLSELNPSSDVRQILAPAQRTINFLLEKIPTHAATYQLRLATIQTSTSWILKNNTPSNETIKNLKTVVERLSNDFYKSTTSLIQSFRMTVMDGDTPAILSYALSLDDAFLKKYRSLRQQAQEVGAVSVFIQYEERFLQRRQKPAYLDDWETILSLAHKATDKAQKARAKSSTKVSDKDFEVARVAVYEISMREGWKPLTFENFEKMTSLTKFIARCKNLSDAISRAACVGSDKFQTSVHGLLSHKRREFNMALSSQIEDAFSQGGFSPEVTEKIAVGFYGPIWATCDGNNLQVRKLALDQMLDYFSKGGPLTLEKSHELSLVLKGCN